MLLKNIFFFVFILIISTNIVKAQNSTISKKDFVWTSMSANSSESMPCGGGDIGLNVWVENGDLLFYASQSGTFDENNQMLKLGRFRISIFGSPFSNTGFEQRLRLAKGDMNIEGVNTKIHIWVDVFKPIVHINVSNKKLNTVNIRYESWRWEDRILKGKELRANSYKVPQKFDVITYKDSILSQKDKISFFHRNRNDVRNIFDYTVQMEGMNSVKSELFNPLSNNTFGGILYGKNMIPLENEVGSYMNTPFKSWSLQTSKNVKEQDITIVLNTGQYISLKDWKNNTDQLLKESLSNYKIDEEKTYNWWKHYWNKSYIELDGENSWISQNYDLFRYQLGCNAFGKWPTKFNGGLFTFDPVLVDSQYHFSPDFRLWGGGTMTAQNQRLVYWSMLKNGDWDLMKPQFDFYLKNLKNAELRSRVYWQHNGACFTEQIENFGLPNIFEYNIKRPSNYDKGLEYNAWLEYQWETVFEFCKMILDTRVYGNLNIREYIPQIESCISFYDEHYQYLASKRGNKIWDGKGKYIFYPTSAAETYKMTYNSTTVISALKVILSEMLQLPDSLMANAQKVKWSTMLQRIPDIPLRTIDGKTVLAPAEVWERIQNTEAPQLYPVFPWGIYGIDRPGFDTAIQTYQLDSQVIKTKSEIGWKQHNIFAARLGLLEDAKSLELKKVSKGKHRFPTFWGPGFDWTPDHNWGGTAMIGLQEMLLQTDGKKIFLLPTWPKEWNGKFKLHAPYNTTVEATILNGKISKLKVFPQNRLSDIYVKNENDWMLFTNQ
ncbi:DUF5703 domain-containing protein [Rhizosphaericola mali]|uniref:DUF5703 domain-containing protein n=1 Tax=Rhizosphaericola mali TaxID=2545455 RepID=A0A5P2G600_9BACT|nr:DUF5703 domain-containing protein [Rhizosphaericola mali]QES88593.1 hypothetical protein E0W69_007945 [Rhizosphaericola mali]